MILLFFFFLGGLFSLKSKAKISLDKFKYGLPEFTVLEVPICLGKFQHVKISLDLHYVNITDLASY